MALLPTVTLADKTFKLSVPYARLRQQIEALASRINTDYRDKPAPLFIGVLNGAFMFMADLVKELDFNCEISFLKIASYSGTATRGKVDQLIGLNTEVKGRLVVIVEDIVDTGNSIEFLLDQLQRLEPASIEIATLILKPDAYRKPYPVKYVAMELPDRFIVGYGLDYNGLGRNLKDIYELSE